MKKTLCFSQHGNFWADAITIKKTDVIDTRGSKYFKRLRNHKMEKNFPKY